MTAISPRSGATRVVPFPARRSVRSRSARRARHTPVVVAALTRPAVCSSWSLLAAVAILVGGALAPLSVASITCTGLGAVALVRRVFEQGPQLVRRPLAAIRSVARTRTCP